MIVRKNKQKGFTLVELITVIAIVSLLAIYLSIEMGDAGEDAKIGMASTFLLANVPSAIHSIKARNAGLCALDADAKPQLEARGLFGQTPWGDDWTAAYNVTIRQLTIAFPTTHADAPAAAATDITVNVHAESDVLMASGGATVSGTTVGDPAISFTAAGTAVTGGAMGQNHYVSCTPATGMACITYKCN